MMFFLCEPSITTITFFKDVDHTNSATQLKKRIKSICQANPWLTGRLIKDKAKSKDKVILSVPQSIDDHDVDAIFASEDEDSTLSPLNSSTPFSDVCTVIGKSVAMVPIGYSLIGKDQRIAKFTFIKSKDQNECLLIVSMTHAAVDGYTYYQILSMLTEDADITSLSYRRKQEFMPEMKEAIGMEEYKLCTSTACILGMIPAMICKSPALSYARFVDTDKVAKIKTEAAARINTSSDSSSSTTFDTFACSTNDILTSTFVQAIGVDLVFMAINLRERTLATNNDAGNYESAILLDQPSTKVPESIRASLRGGVPFRRTNGDPLPGFWKLLKTKYGMITNWAFPGFKADLKLRTASDEEAPDGMTLHLPMVSPTSVVFPYAIIFRPCKDKLAILYMGSARDLQIDRLREEGAPLGALVNDKMFAE